MWVDAALAVIAGAAAVPSATFAVQVLLSRRPTPAAVGVAVSSTQRAALAVLIPAHDEAAGIGRTLETVRPQLQAGDRVLVVADNCSDDTAARARAAGADVTERHDDQRRGKGYALDHGVRWLSALPEPPAVVVFLDADCRLAPGSLDHLADAVVARGTAVQALDLMHAPPGAPLQTRIAEFAWLVKNQVRPMGMLAMGLPCQLMGTGMAMPWDIVRQAPLASGALAEDVELGLALAEAGRAPVFCPQAAVHSLFPSSDAGTQAQRRRWEHGHLTMIARRGLPLLGRGLRRRDPALLSLALDICVPPLASLVMGLAALTIVAAGWSWLGGSPWPATLATGSLGAVTAAVLWAWHRDGRHVIAARELASAPAYALRKLPLYWDAIRGRRASWQRARRDDD